MVATDKREEEDVTAVFRGEDMDPNADDVQIRQLQATRFVSNTEENGISYGYGIPRESWLLAGKPNEAAVNERE